MSVRLSADGTIELHGVCSIEDAEILHRHLLAAPRATVDWRSCEQAHAAVIQVLMAARASLLGPPSGHLLRLHVESALKAPPA